MNKHNWQSTSTINALQKRADLTQKIRHFFAERAVLEVETPILSQHSVTAPYIQSFKTPFVACDGKTKDYYLQTSPEYAMKRLLAAGSGAIYQLSKAFRNGDQSEIHNPEFTMLEWYRPGFDLNQLMDEVDALLQLVLATPAATRFSYQGLFEHTLKINPFTYSTAALQKFAEENAIHLASDCTNFDRDTWLQLIMGHLIEPQLGYEAPVFIYDFPASQAALARLNPNNPEVAARFEVYAQGMELANGFYELCEANEQRKRFVQDQKQRAQLNFESMAIDEYLLGALEHGLPDCSGVALGIDRLMMIAFNTKKIKDVISFDWARA